MYPAHTQLVAKWSSPSIGDQRATGCPISPTHILINFFSKVTNSLILPLQRDNSIPSRPVEELVQCSRIHCGPVQGQCSSSSSDIMPLFKRWRPW